MKKQNQENPTASHSPYSELIIEGKSIDRVNMIAYKLPTLFQPLAILTRRFAHHLPKCLTKAARARKPRFMRYLNNFLL